jgi:hypothetical protein
VSSAVGGVSLPVNCWYVNRFAENLRTQTAEPFSIRHNFAVCFLPIVKTKRPFISSLTITIAVVAEKGGVAKTVIGKPH